MSELSLIDKTRANIREKHFTTLSGKGESGIYLFFSFDLVNSTQFKLLYATRWPLVIMWFYDLAISQLNSRLALPQVWKFIGDEVLFFTKLQTKADLFKALPAAHDASHAVTEILHNRFPETRELLAVKSTVWLARADTLPPRDIEEVRVDGAPCTARNIVVDGPMTSRLNHTDFLGPDIDIGFRISRHSLRSRTVVGADLAWLLYRFRGENSKIESQLRIVSYEVLKGVWAGRYYPIIWYEENWQTPARFLYDEQFTSKTVEKICKREFGPDSEIKTIEAIFSDSGRADEMENLANEIIRLQPSAAGAKPMREFSFGGYAELHCVAVCFSRDGKVLVAKRPDSKRRFSGKYEFGCGQLRFGESFKDCILRAYKDDFGVLIDFPPKLIPVDCFTINDLEESREIPGIIFFAIVNNPAEVEGKFSREKHSEVIWIDPTCPQLSESACVPGFLDTLDRAQKAFAEWQRLDVSNVTLKDHAPPPLTTAA